MSLQERGEILHVRESITARPSLGGEGILCYRRCTSWLTYSAKGGAYASRSREGGVSFLLVTKKGKQRKEGDPIGRPSGGVSEPKRIHHPQVNLLGAEERTSASEGRKTPNPTKKNREKRRKKDLH